MEHTGLNLKLLQRENHFRNLLMINSKRRTQIRKSKTKYDMVFMI